MFTGIIQAVGKITSIEKTPNSQRLTVNTGNLDLTNTQLGDSIAVNGVCLTAVVLTEQSFSADVSNETIACTTLSVLSQGSPVNLEKALTPTTHLGGHLVSGHVDGIGTITARCQDGQSVRFTIKAPAELAKYIATKGSICIDGISLTVNTVNGAEFELNIVPHTLQETIIGHHKIGTAVNLEVDLIARYLERLILGEKAATPNSAGITSALLQEHGFIS
ncbi:MAG: riboflavin synthase [Gammaproteobacteria bacterium]|nr:riboflavin synthase [Gammaproteobacteria bacterium]